MSVRRPRLLGPALTTAVMLAVLLGLGTWQVRRLEWKNALIAQLDEAERTPPVPLGDSPPAPYAIVSMKGHLRPDLASHYRVGLRDFLSGSVPGSELLVPVERVGAPPVLVDLGWVPQHGPPLALPTGDAATITGYVRPAVHVGFFGTTDDAGTRLFTILDPGVIGPALGLPTMAPFTVIALGPPPKDPGVPIPAEHLPRPENNHLQYAITWYSLAVVLLLVFSRYLWNVLRA